MTSSPPPKSNRKRPANGAGKARPGASAAKEQAPNSDTREVIIAAAKRCFADSGYNGTTNKMIAAEAGIAPGLIYYYFESKEELFVAVFANMYQQRDLRLADYHFTEHTLRENLATMLRDSTKLAQEDPSFVDVFTLSYREVSRNPGLERAWKAHWDDTVHVWTRIVRAAVSRGEVPPEHEGGLVDMLVAWFSGFLMWVSRQPDDHRVHEATDEFLRLVDAYVDHAHARVT